MGGCCEGLYNSARASESQNLKAKARLLFVVHLKALYKAGNCVNDLNLLLLL